MLSDEQLAAILSEHESDRVEFTRSIDKIDKFAQAVCAFANDFAGHRKPGYLLIGVDDDGKPSGLTVTDQLKQKLVGWLRSDGNIQPLPAITVNKHSLSDGEVAVVEVLPSDLPPVRYKGLVWIRVGPSKAIASEQEERLLSERRVSYARSFDALPCQDSSLRDLSLGLFDAYRRKALPPEVIEANHRTVEEQLASLRFFDPRRQCPSHAGLLLLGLAPRHFLPGAYIQYLRMPGDSLADAPLDQAEIHGDLEAILRELDARIRANINATLKPVSALREETLHDYPERAIRELLMNAIMHRDYQSHTPIRFYWFDDHIEIQSPGGLYGEVTKDNFMTHNSYRNPIIAETMKTLGYVNRYGYGIQAAQKLLVNNGNPPAHFEFDGRTVSVNIGISNRPKYQPTSPAPKKIRNVLGAPVRGNDFFGREDFLRRLSDALTQGQSILLMAPRRFGKTSVIQQLANRPAWECHVVYSDLEGYQHPVDWLIGLWETLGKHAGLGRLVSENGGLAGDLAELARENADNLRLTGARKQLRKAIKADWQECLCDLLRRVATADKPVVFCLDELPCLLNRLHTTESGWADAVALMHRLRQIRQELPAVRFVLLGSIGMIRPIRQTGSIISSPFVNDCITMALPPFSQTEAERFLDCVADSYGLDLNTETRAAILAAIDTPIPYFLQKMFAYLCDAHKAGDAALSPELVDSVYQDKMLGVESRVDFQYYYESIKQHYPARLEKIAKSILSELAKSGEISRDTCHQIYQSLLSEQGDIGEFAELMADLESDNYITYDAKSRNYRFYLKLLRDWWLRYYTPIAR